MAMLYEDQHSAVSSVSTHKQWSFKRPRKDIAQCPDWYIISQLLLLLKVVLLSGRFQECLSRIQPQGLYAVSGNWYISHAVPSRTHQGIAVSGSQGNTGQSGNAGSQITFYRIQFENVLISDTKSMHWPMCLGHIKEIKASLKKLIRQAQ